MHLGLGLLTLALALTRALTTTLTLSLTLTWRAAASSARFFLSPSASGRMARADAPRFITPDGRRTRVGAVAVLGLPSPSGSICRTWLGLQLRLGLALTLTLPLT